MTCSGTNEMEGQLSWQWHRDRLEQWQIEQFNRQLDRILRSNRFYQQKMADAGLTLDCRLKSLKDLSHWPETTKQELVQAAKANSEGISSHHTFEAHQYSRMHRTSGTTGDPLMILDSDADWQWWSTTWQHVLAAAEVTSNDRVFLAFSFGPFIGFWSAHQACVDRGAMVIPGGGMSTLARLEFLRQSAATVVCCTPTYALHMAQVAQAEQFPLDCLPVNRLIVAGEAGGSLPAVRRQIEQRWVADLIDHAGATEIGPWGFGFRNGCGLHVIETSFIAELLPVDHLPLKDDAGSQDTVGELVLTSLGRYGCPVIRYRTGDVVRMSQRECPSPLQCNFRWLPEGIIGRVDQMITVRGVNVFPSSIDSLVRSIESIGEYRVTVTRAGQLDQLEIDVESSEPAAEPLEKLLALKLGLRVNVSEVPWGTLPQSEGKARRWIDQRKQDSS